MSLSLPQTCNMGSSQTGLVGTIGVALLNPNGTTHTVRTTAGIFEIGGGCYGKLFAFDDNWSGVIVWDTGGATPYYAVVEYNIEGLVDAVIEDTNELQTDWTNDGRLDLILDAIEQRVGILTSGTAAVNTTALDSPNGFVITSGTNEVNNEDSTHEEDGIFHTIEPATGTTDVYYIFDVGIYGVPVSVTWVGYLNGQGDSSSVHAWNWTASAWDQIGSANGANGTTKISAAFDLTTSHVGTGANVGKVHIRAYSTDATKLATDRILCSYAIDVTSLILDIQGAGFIKDTHSLPQCLTATGFAVPNEYDTSLADIPTVTEFEARTLPSADYIVTSDTIAGVGTATNLTNAPTIGDLTAAMKASVNAEVDTALTDYDPPTRTEATADKAEVIAEVDANEAKIDAGFAAVPDTVLDEVVEGGYTMRQLLRGFISVLAGNSAGGGTTTLTFQDIADSKARITATVDINGNRTNMVLDLS